MNQEKERAKAIARIRMFNNRTTANGFTDAEAQQAMERISELLTVYNIELSEVWLNEQSCVEMVIDTKSRRSNRGTIAVAIAKLCDCITYRRTNSDYNEDFVFYGLPQDIEMVSYLYDIVDNSLKFSLNKYKNSYEYKNFRGHRGSITNNFIKSFIYRIVERINTLKKENDKRYMDEISRGAERQDRHHLQNGKSLVEVKTDKVMDEFKDKYNFTPKYVTKRIRDNLINEGRRAGREMANDVKLNNSVNSNAPIAAITYGG